MDARAFQDQLEAAAEKAMLGEALTPEEQAASVAETYRRMGVPVVRAVWDPHEGTIELEIVTPRGSG